MNEYLLLKFGAVKQWNLMKKENVNLIKKYCELGVSMGALSQNDTPEQKKILCEIIDGLDGRIQSDWTGKLMTKEEAKNYIMTGENKWTEN